MRRRQYTRRKAIGTLGAVGVFGLAGCAEDEPDPGAEASNDDNGDQDAEIELTMSGGSPSPTEQGNIRDPFKERVTELTDGRVTWTDDQHAEAVGDAQDIANLIIEGTFEMGYIPFGWTPDIFQYASVAGIPGLWTDVYKNNEVYWELIKPPMADGGPGLLYEKEFESEGLVPLSPYCHPQYNVISNERITGLETFEGMTLRGGGMQEVAASFLDAEAVNMAPADSYEAIERGTLDASMTALNFVMSYSLEEVIDYASTNLALGSFAHSICVNKNAWDGYPDWLKEAMLEAGKEGIQQNIENYMESERHAIEEGLPDAGVEVYEVEEDSLNEILEAIEPVQDWWVDQVDGRQEVLDEYIEIQSELSD